MDRRNRRWFGDAPRGVCCIVMLHLPGGPMAIRSYRDLDVWSIAMQLAEQCYVLSRKFPRDERYGLVLQLRRCATSIPANIAEGHGRAHAKGYLHHLSLAQGSLNELYTLLLLSLRLGYLKEADFVETRKSLDRVAQMLPPLARRLRSREEHTRTPSGGPGHQVAAE